MPRSKSTGISRRFWPRRFKHELPELTAGRYAQVTVDPASLEVLVQMRDGRRRRARHLSQGTREQIYLLLRVALLSISPSQARSFR